ncbi:MAG: prepilin-type N-terminal cleavage/methylation domain-containing protein [Planctomycetota bacterium]
MKSSRSGHTLVEMTVVVTLLAAVMSMVARAQRPFSEMILELQDRATTSSELHLAADYLATDLGGAERVERIRVDRIRIIREAARAQTEGLGEGVADPGILYRLVDGQLVREDKIDGEKFVVATGLTGFEVAPQRRGELRMQLSDGIAENDQHAITLVWKVR